jgi:hypothetical protein
LYFHEKGGSPPVIEKPQRGRTVKTLPEILHDAMLLLQQSDNAYDEGAVRNPPSPRVLGALIKDSATADLATCGYCERGFRRVSGIHIGSQRLGMIPDSPCDRVFVMHGGNMTDDNKLPWMAHVDGDVLRKRSGDARRFSSAETAYSAAQAAATKKWHP